MKTAAAAGALAATGCNSETASETRPNIVLIMADDMGFSDIGCYGGEIQTPTLDALAAGGLRFKHFYNGARCCPTRASLLTGLYAHQAGVGHMMEEYRKDGELIEAYQGQLNDRCVTIAEALKPAGYTTLLSGKWHVSPAIDRSVETPTDKHNWPRQRGFDR
ncbi:MAG: sulfatase-like hydrolase/transferase, partial [Acidobacteria bacterium]|nr:sulfatase-like hydrolase/transferase [Acidobacteriota bacterium]